MSRAALATFDEGAWGRTSLGSRVAAADPRAVLRSCHLEPKMNATVSSVTSHAPASRSTHVPDPGAKPLVARRDRVADARDAMTRVFRTRGQGLVTEFAGR